MKKSTVKSIFLVNMKAFISARSSIEFLIFIGLFWATPFSYASIPSETEAFDELRKAIALNPSDETAYLKRGDLYDVSGEYDLAITDFTKAIEINPKNSSAYFKRALARRYKADKTQAIKDYGKAIDLEPTNTGAFIARGNIFADEKEYKKAISDFSQAIKIKPEYLSYYYRGDAHMQEHLLHARGLPKVGASGHRNRAIEDFTSAININPEGFGAAGANIYGKRAYLYFLRHEFDKSWQDIHSAEAFEERLYHKSTIMDSEFVKILKAKSGRDE